MNGFRGKSQHTLDPKGRLIIPSRFRSVVKASREEALMITIFDGALHAYTMEEWDTLETKMRHARGKYMGRAKRLILGSAMPCTLDKQGRIQIPKELREYAGIEPDGGVVLLGLVERFEIWQSAKLQKEQQAIEADLKTDDAREELMEFGF